MVKISLLWVSQSSFKVSPWVQIQTPFEIQTWEVLVFHYLSFQETISFQHFLIFQLPPIWILFFEVKLSLLFFLPFSLQVLTLISLLVFLLSLVLLSQVVSFHLSIQMAQISQQLAFILLKSFWEVLLFSFQHPPSVYLLSPLLQPV